MTKESSSLFRQRDILILLIVIITLFVTYYEQPSLEFSLEAAFFLDEDVGSNRNKRNSFVKPIVTDLDGDGFNELIFVTNDFTLQVNCFISIIIK